MNSVSSKTYVNGITLVYRQVDNPHFFYLTQYYSIGSKDFSVGLLHFLEHCAFSHPKGISVQEYQSFLRNNNITKSASTSREFLEFHYSGLQEDWEKVSQSFFDCFENKEISDDVFHNEQTRIFHEIEEEDVNDTLVNRENFSHLYKDEEMIRSPLGDKKSVVGYTQDDLVTLLNQITQEPFVVYIQSSLPFETILEKFDKRLSSISSGSKIPTKNISYATGGSSSVELNKQEENTLIQYSFLSRESYTLKEYVLATMVTEFLSFDGYSPLSQKMRFGVGVYDYAIDKLFYRHGILIALSFLINTESTPYVQENIVSWVTHEVELSKDEFLALKKKLKFDYLQYLSNPYDRFETEREWYQLFGEDAFTSSFVEVLEAITLTDLQNFAHKLIKESLSSLVFGVKQKKS